MASSREIAIGVDLGGTNTRLSLVDREGTIRRRQRMTTEVRAGRDHVIGRLADEIVGLRTLAERDGCDVIGVGIGSPGAILIDSGVVTSSPNFPDWKDVPLKDRLEGSTGLPVTVDNDANCIAMGESWAGAGRDVDSLVCLTLGTGVGGGVILNGEIWHGALGMAGEVGHITVEPEGEPCNCGNRGCLECYASAAGISHLLEKELAKGVSSRLSEIRREGGYYPVKSIYECAKAGDELSRRIFATAGRYLGIAVANVIHLLNVEMIVIGGGIRDAWALYYDVMIREISTRVYSIAGEKTRVEPAQLGEDSGVIGAAKIVFGAERTPCGDRHIL